MKVIVNPKALALLASLLLLTAGCGSSGSSNNAEDSHINSSAVSASAQGAVITPDWQEVKQLPQAEARPGMPADAVTVSVQRLKDFGGGITVTFYTLPGDEDYVYADLSTAAAHYSLGSIGTYNYRKPENLIAEAVSVFNSRMLKITGGLGANSALSRYYTIDEKGVPEGVLLVDTGHAREIDIDRDGAAEVLSAHGTPTAAYVYRLYEGHAEEAYINAALQADSVVLRDDLIFEASHLGHADVQEYRFTPEGLIRQHP
ncbi:hypothetical protein R70723_28765 [Paenibacillus sp. FSL R7-0273]|uniref:hypothetical protein n=1 Tax=Paenibacillus sp. FSL R7-0273 TaxID=1536772 RepID=UPI0004F70D1F|nr:hypothetical protein [Paenibacillus sp. FSL R7-0273]AIQ49430.1 hypothetical protein R70723_28765 [Paenibacillus sp. FSL R7-0273]OMF89632.1 hypothetical protein BK144_18895 [Paenibacillus sp. FSL R7-0273]